MINDVIGSDQREKGGAIRGVAGVRGKVAAGAAGLGAGRLRRPCREAGTETSACGAAAAEASPSRCSLAPKQRTSSLIIDRWNMLQKKKTSLN